MFSNDSSIVISNVQVDVEVSQRRCRVLGGISDLVKQQIFFSNFRSNYFDSFGPHATKLAGAT